MQQKIYRWVTSILVFILSLIAAICYWYFIFTGYEIELYGIIGAFIAIHGALFGIILWQYLEYKELLFSEWWDKTFKKKK